MRARILLRALGPVALIMLIIFLIVLHGVVSHLRSRTGDIRRDTTTVLQRSLYTAILVTYLMLPGVSRSIFKARQCISYNNNDSPSKRRSYLIADLSVQCNADEDARFASYNAFFWVIFAMWPVLVPLIYMLLLVKATPAVRAQRLTPLANACRFLWRDYSAGLLFWEVIDLMRRLLL